MANEPRIIKGYELKELLGQGGYGAVYRGFQTVVEREVAIKIILPSYANDPEFIRNFEAEAQTVARLEHPFIIPLFDFWREPDSAYLVMRYLRGGSLRSKLKNGDFGIDEILHYVENITSALSFAHRNGVVHRDLKPDNILLDAEGNAYLSDFGIARHIGRNPTSDNISGSVAYMSPDQLRNDTPAPQADIYSLGIMLYELFTGQYPYGELQTWQLVNVHLNDPLPNIVEANSDLPDEVNQVLQKATEKDPSQRFTDARELWQALQRAFKRSSAPSFIDLDESAIVNPYKGLRAFQEADAADFFGRELLVNQLLDRMVEEDQYQRFLAVVGPSGSGKSSVVRAGLVPQIRGGMLPGSENWFVLDFVPGTSPLRQLEAALLSIATRPPSRLYEMLKADIGALTWAIDRVLADVDGDLLLIIDQFEEVFTMLEDETERLHFLELLKTAVTSPDSRLRIITTLRADFMDRPLEYASFGELMRSRTEFVLPLSAEEIERAITGPAHRVGLTVDTDLIAAIIADVSEEPGALPLLQYALTEVFERRTGRRLTLAAYQESGGVLGALARRAEEVFVELDESQQKSCRQILLRMVTLGEGTEDTRRRASRSELAQVVESSDALQLILNAFGGPRLLSFDVDPGSREPMIEVAHEALIREWQRLRGWLDNSRVDLRLQRVLSGEAGEWQKSGSDPSFLLSGTRLNQYEEWWQTTDLALTQNEKAYLQASIVERARRDAAEIERKKREEEIAARASTFETRATQLRRAAIGLGIVIALAIAAAIGLSITVVNTQNEVAAGQTDIAGVQPTLAAADTQIAGVVPTLEAANEQIFAASSQIANANVQVEVANEQIATATAQISTAQSQIESANLQVASGETEVAGFAPTVAAANAQIDLANTQVAGVQPTLNAASARIDDAGTQIAGGQTEVAGFAPTISSANTQVAGFAPTLSAADTQIAGVAPTLNSANTQVAGVEPTIAAANAQIESANLQVASGETEVAGFAPTIAAANTQVAGVEPTVNAANAQVTQANVEIQRANTQVSSANTQVAGVEPTLDAAQAEIALANTQIAGVAPTLASADLRIAEASTQIAVGQTEVAGFAPTVEAANAQISFANTEVAGVQPTLLAANARIDDAGTQIAGGQTQVAGFEPTISSANTQVAGFAPTLSAADTQIAGVAPTLNSANTQVAGVQPTLDSANTQIAGVVPTLSSVETEVASQREIAEALRLVRSAGQLLEAGNPDLAIALVLNAYNLNPQLGEVQRILNDSIPLTVRLSEDASVSMFTNDGRWVILGGDDGVEVWDLETRGLLHSMGTAGVTAMALSPDDERLIVGTHRGNLYVFDTRTGNQRFELRGHRAAITDIDYSPTAPEVVSGDVGGVALLWNVDLGEQINQLPEPQGNEIVKVAFNENGSSSFSYSLRFDNGLQTRLPQIGVFNLGLSGAFRNSPEYRGFSPNGRIAYNGGDGVDFLTFFDADSTVEQRTFRLGNSDTDYIEPIAFSNDGRYILVEVESRAYSNDLQTFSVLNRYVALWEIATGGEIRRFNIAVEDPRAWDVTSLAFSVDGQLALVGGRFNTINTVTLFDVNTGEELRRYTGHETALAEVAFSNNGSYAMSRSRDGNVRIWDIGNIELNIVNQTAIAADSIEAFGISADGNFAYTLVNNRSITTYDLTTNSEVGGVDVFTGEVRHIAFSPTQSLALVVAFDRMALYDLATTERLFVWDDVEPQNVSAVAFSPDGRYIFYNDGSQIVRWDTVSQEVFQTFRAQGGAPHSLAPSDNNEFLAYGSTSEIWVVDLVTGEEVQSFEHDGGPINSLDYSPNGDSLISAVGEPDNSVIVWDLQTGLPRYTLIGHTAAVNVATFSQNGLSALSGGDDLSLILWDLTSGQPIREYNGHSAAIQQIAFNPEFSTAYSRSSVLSDGIITWRVESISDTVNWVYTNRYIREIDCLERMQYGISPLCGEDGVIPTPQDTPTPQATATLLPSATPRPSQTPTPTAIPTGRIISDGAVNVRSGAGTGFQVLGRAENGMVVEILGEEAETGWINVRLPDGTVGWIRQEVVDR
jgi:serine/threonine protein kinase/WD40 repeat protein/predicted  nucleic acid-binding Zn-ribbon protein